METSYKLIKSHKLVCNRFELVQVIRNYRTQFGMYNPISHRTLIAGALVLQLGNAGADRPQQDPGFTYCTVAISRR